MTVSCRACEVEWRELAWHEVEEAGARRCFCCGGPGAPGRLAPRLVEITPEYPTGRGPLVRPGAAFARRAGTRVTSNSAAGGG